MLRLAASLALLLASSQFISCSAYQPSVTQEQLQERERAAREALERLYATTPGARALAKSAEGILVFPDLTKAGFMVGGQFGKGVLFKEGQVAGFYESTAVSYGLQAGVQKFGYALFFMTKSDLDYLDKSDGWEVGFGPSVTIVDKGIAKSFTTTTAKSGVYAFFFEQRGLMAGLGLQGTKITKTASAS